MRKGGGETTKVISVHSRPDASVRTAMIASLPGIEGSASLVLC